MFEETHLGESCKGVTAEMSLNSIEVVDLVSSTLLELIPTPFTCSSTSPPLDFSLVKTMNDDVITDLNDDLGIVDVEIE